jgi:trimeric autotransporter adhesin
VTAANGGGSLSLSGATIPGNGSCTVTVNLTSASAGSYLDSSGPVTTGNAGTGSAASATLIASVTPLLSVAKTASPGSAVPGQLISYTATLTNPSSGYATGVVLTDTLSPYAYWGVNAYGAGVSFQFSEGTPASGLVLGTPVYSKDGGATWSYLPVSGAGGAPAGYDGLVTNWQIPMTGVMNPVGAKFSVNYRVLLR